jgi:hypothetical protein
MSEDVKSWYVTRDGAAVSGPLTSENDCFRWLHKHQGQSADWAMKHSGYGFAQLTAEEVEANKIITLYHYTTPDNARRIRESGRFVSHEGNEVCLTDTLGGYATGYGRAAVVLSLPQSLLTLDDEFETGERHYRVDLRRIPVSAITSIA